MKANGHAIEENDASRTLMHKYLRRSRRHFSPDTAPSLEPVTPAPVSPEVMQEAIAEDHDDIREQMRLMLEQFPIAEGEGARSVAERLRLAIGAQLELLDEGRIRDVHVSTTPGKRNEVGTWVSGHKVVVTSYHG